MLASITVAFISPGTSGIVTFFTAWRFSMKSAYSGAFVLSLAYKAVELVDRRDEVPRTAPPQRQTHSDTRDLSCVTRAGVRGDTRRGPGT